MVFVWCGSGPVLCCFAVFSAGETQIWLGDLRVVAVAGRRCCRVFSRCFGFSMMCLVYEAKVFHIFCTLFYRFSHCQDRALERDRPQQREKKRDGDASRSRGKIFVIQLLLQSGHCQAQRGAGRIRRLRRTVPFTFRRLEGRLQGGGLQGGLQALFKRASRRLEGGFTFVKPSRA